MSYTWANAEQTSLKYEDEDQTWFIPADPANRHYAEYLASGETAAAYVEPPVQQDLRTDAEKLEQSTGLTVDELKGLLGI